MEANQSQSGTEFPQELDPELVSVYLKEKFGMSLEDAESALAEARAIKEQSSVQSAIEELAAGWGVTPAEAERRVGVANDLFSGLPAEQQQAYSGIDGVQVLYNRAVRSSKEERAAVEAYERQSKGTDKPSAQDILSGSASTLRTPKGSGSTPRFRLSEIMEMSDSDYTAKDAEIYQAILDGGILDDIPSLVGNDRILL